MLYHVFSLKVEAKIKFISNLDDFDKGTLEEFQNHSPLRRERIRAQAILLSNKGFKIKSIVDIVKHDRDTISAWIDNFNNYGLASISDGIRPGRPSKLDELNQLTALIYVDDTPVSLKAVLSQILEELGVRISISTLKRILKKYGLSWKRIRKSLKSRRDEEAFQKAKEEINELLEKAKKKR